MAALISSFNQSETTKMPPISSIVQQDVQSPKSPKKALNGDTKPFFPRQGSMKKKLKWSLSDRHKSESSSPAENEKNKFNEIKSKLSSKSASSFFSSKSDKNQEDDLEQLSPTDSGLADISDNRNSSDLEKTDRDDCHWAEDDSLLTTPQDKHQCRESTGSINFIEKVVQEILSTEKTYVNNLGQIIEGYLKCMRMKNCPISKPNVKHLFINIENIYAFNREFLNQIESADEDPVEIAECFVKNEIGFQTYTEYCTNYPKSVEILTECTRQRETSTFIQEIQKSLGHSLPLGSYLLKPVQRILKYHLLLQEMKKRFDKENDLEGFEIICDALFAMTHVARYINEMKRQHEATLHVQEIQSKLSEYEDTFRVMGTRTDRYLFLFEKILLITKKRERENGYTCKASLLLSNMMMTESLPKEPLAFQIIRFDNQKITYPFMARTAEQKSKWTLALKKLLVESLVATVPLKAKALILGESNVDEDNASETESPRRSCTSPITSRRQSGIKGSSPSPSSQDSPKRRLTLDSDDNKEQDENNNGPMSPNPDVLFTTTDEQQSQDSTSEDTDLKRSRTSSFDDSDTSQGRIKPLTTPVDIQWLPKRSTNHNDTMFLFDKYASVSDLRSRGDSSSASNLSESDVDIAKQLGDITENSKIHRTVREVARAFSYSEYLESSAPCSPNVQMEPREGRGLDELLESIDRELDETRRTINSAQLLESAIKLKQDHPLKTPWPPHEKRTVLKNGVLKEARTDRLKVNDIKKRDTTTSLARSASFSSRPNNSAGNSNEEDRDLKAEIAAFQQQSPKYSQFITEKHRTCSLDRRRTKKVFELSPRNNRFSTGNVNAENSDERRSVNEMARQYSRRVKDENAAEVRSRVNHSNDNDEKTSPPQLKIERVTKVKFDCSLEKSSVIRRRRRHGSRNKRSSWSHEDGKVDVDFLRLKIERPRSLHEIKPQKELIDVNCDEYQFTEGLDEGLAPALLAGMEKNDVVVRGLVKHLVSKFGNDSQHEDDAQSLKKS